MLLPTTGSHVVKTDGQCIDAVSVRDGAIFIVLSTDAISLWHAATLTQLHCIRRVTSSLESTGFNRRLVLRDDGNLVLVQTMGDVLLVYDLCEHRDVDTRLFTSAEDPGMPQVWLKHRQSIRVEAGVLALCATRDLLMLSTKRPAMVQSLRWQKVDGKIQTDSTAVASISFLKSNSTRHHAARPIDIHYSVLHRRFLWITDDGNAFLVVAATNQEWLHQIVYDSHTNGSSAILAAFNDALSLLVVALSNGEMITYEIKISDSASSPTQLLSYHCDNLVGALRSISYSDDGSTLLICGESGWTLYSAFGTKLHSSPSLYSSGSPVLQDENRLASGLRSSVWIRGSYGALFLPVEAEEFCVKSFCIVTEQMYQFQNRIMSFEAGEVAHSHADEHFNIGCKNIIPPTDVLDLVQPLKFVASSPCKRFLAIGGKHGLAHLSMASGVWKTYTDLGNDEYVTLIAKPVWYHHYLVVAVSIDKDAFEIRLLSREYGLEDVLDTIVLEQQPLLICVVDGLLYAILADHTVLKSQILRSKDKSISLQTVSRSAFQWEPLTSSTAFRSMSVIHDSGDPNRAYMLFICGTCLYTVSLSPPEGVPLCPVPIAARVQWFTVIDGLSRLKNAIFVFDGERLKLWFNLLSTTGLSDAFPKANVLFELDFLPLSVSGEQGLIQGVVLENTVVCSAEVMRPTGTRYQTRSFVPDVLEVLLQAGLVGEAFAISTRFAAQPQFPYVLEVLLFKALESTLGKHSESLPMAWKLLQKYAHLMPQVVVACARKSELSAWKTLFSVTGPPLHFYQESLARLDLKTAGAYLMILLTLDKKLEHKEYTLYLIRKAIAVHDWDLAIELSRFYSVVVDDKATVVSELSQIMRISEVPG